MTRFLHRFRTLGRLTSWLLVVCLLSSGLAPAIHAQTASKANLETVTDADEESQEEATSDEQDEEQEDEEADDSEAAASEDDEEDDEDEDGPELFSRVPRSDRTQLNRTLTSLLGGLTLGVLGLSFGMVGFAIAGVIGAGIGYWVGTELFPDRASESPGYVAYDAYYGPGSNTYPVRTNGFSTQDGTPLRELEERYFETLEEYRRALRSNDIEESGIARQAYTEAYQAYLTAKRVGN